MPYEEDKQSQTKKTHLLIIGNFSENLIKRVKLRGRK